MELTQEIKDIMSKGVPVEYTSEKALPKKEALELVDKLLEANIPVLGGEVVSWDAKGILSYNYDGWYCNFFPEEALTDYVCRSVRKAKEYLYAYKVDEVLFVVGFDPDFSKEKYQHLIN